MEWHGLPDALKSIFPAHEFHALPTEEEIASYPDEFPYDGFTSTTLTAAHLQKPPGSALNLVRRAASAVSGRNAYDLVLIVDDVELSNLSQHTTGALGEEHIVEVFRAAVKAHLAALSTQLVESKKDQATFAKTEKALREKVCFHLLAPMIEAWLFGDPQALVRAGVPSNVAPEHTRDLENFTATDPAYIAANVDDVCTCWKANGCKSKLKPAWGKSLPRAHHPKGYLQWLCLDPAAKNCTRYSETGGGAAALKSLDFAAVVSHGTTPYLCALIEDLEQLLGRSAVPLPSPPVSVATNGPSTVLRNI
jgi:hypothetical protein